MDLPAQEVADILTRIGLEVEEIILYEPIKGGMKGLVIGLVNSVEKHPDADKLQITKTSIGGSNDLQIVCGAPNVAAGQKVIVATEGVEVFPTEGEKFKIKKSKIRGVISEGMICSESEMGLSTDHSGIVVLPADAKVGTAAKDFYKIESDYIFEVGLTPNRSDAFSHIGVARDLAAYLKVKKDWEGEIKIPYPEMLIYAASQSPISVTVENVHACPRYMGLLISDVKIGESPQWIKDRLQAVGVRSINNVVDITNFVLHEYGQPLHAFDADKIRGNKIIVKNLSDNTPFVTLDNKEVKLSSRDLMICDAEGGMCIAGVFGGIHSGVTESTKNIFLESAHFHAGTIRQTATRHNLRTDAAIHFEKGIDPEIAPYALKRAATLMVQYAGAKLKHKIEEVNTQKPSDKIIQLGYRWLNERAGIEIPFEEVENILQALQFKLIKEEDGISSWYVPAHKLDMERDVDLMEEVLRIYGYDNIPMPEHLHSSLSYSQPEDADRKQIEKISDYLSANGFSEMMNNSIVNSKAALESGSVNEEQILRFLNYANTGLDSMRTSLLYSGLEVIQRNQNRKHGDLKLYEIGKTYLRENEKFSEKSQLALFLYGKSNAENWKTESSDTDFYELKAYIENILALCGIVKYTLTPFSDEKYENGLAFSQGKTLLVRLGWVDEKTCGYYDLKSSVFFAELYLDNLLPGARSAKVKFRELSKFQPVRRDLALVMDKSVKYSEIEKEARHAAGKLLKAVNLFDVYEDEKLGKDKKSYAVSFIFSDDEKTLTDSEIDQLMNKISQAIQLQTKATIRQ